MKSGTKYLVSIIFILNGCSSCTDEVKDCGNKCNDVEAECVATDSQLAYCNVDPSTLFTPAITSYAEIKIETITTAGGYSIPFRRVILSNGIPNHDIGHFGKDPFISCGRPDTLQEQSYEYKIPLISGITEHGEKIYKYFEPPTLFGIAINGIPFDPEAAEWYRCNSNTGWQKSALDHPDMANDLDCNNGHIQGANAEHPGAYHYHGLPTKLYEMEGGTYPGPLGSVSELTDRKTVLLGWAFDGAPIYGPLCYIVTKKKSGPLINWWKPKSGWTKKAKPMSSPPYCEPPDAYNGYYDEDYEYTGGDDELDECNGHFAPTPENPDGIYHYHITLEYPYISRCFTEMKYKPTPH